MIGETMVPAKRTQRLRFPPTEQLLDSTAQRLKHLQTSCIQAQPQQNKLKLRPALERRLASPGGELVK